MEYGQGYRFAFAYAEDGSLVAFYLDIGSSEVL